jgi:multicomponent K+:H+ antiporter subunit A
MIPILMVFAPAAAALILAAAPQAHIARLTAVIPALIFAALLSLTGQSDIPQVEIQWVESLSVSLSLWIDGLGLLFGLIISGMGALVLIYAGGYFEEARDLARFNTLILLFMGAMLGIVFSRDLLMIFFFWEITSVTSFLLIGFYSDSESARDGARRALLVTSGGALALLAGLILLGLEAGSFDLVDVLASGNAIRESALYTPIVVLVLLGAFTKSAQWPFHFWLPGAMDAPTPASAYLHSATMVKAGIFLLARLSPALNDTDLWLYSLTGFGLITFVYGAVIALRQSDIKSILAYSTISWLGALVALQGSDSEYAAAALMTGILAHALYKGAWFLTAGSIDHGTGTRQIDRLGGLWREMPFTFAGALIASFSMAGLPPVMGFLAKETFKAASLYEGLPGGLRLIFPAAAVIGSAFTVAIALWLLVDVFLTRREHELPHHPHEVSPALWLHGLILGAMTLGLTLAISPVVDPLVGQAAAAMRQADFDLRLHLFEGITPPLIMSAISIAAGVMIFAARKLVIRRLRAAPEFNPTGVYQWLFFEALTATAETLTARLQSGRLRHYMAIVMATFIVSALGTIAVSRLTLIGDTALEGFDWRIAILCGLLMVGALAGILASTRLSAVAILGIEGALLSLVFALFGAPDLAFTQLMIEVVTLVLFVLAFHFMPDAFKRQPTRRNRFGDLLLSIGAGVTITTLILAARANPIAGERISEWHIANALTEGQGYNIVNIILVDFRAMDTQGEIVVLVIAAMGITALLRLRPSDQPRGQYIDDDETTTYEMAAETPPVTALPGSEESLTIPLDEAAKEGTS